MCFQIEIKDFWLEVFSYFSEKLLSFFQNLCYFRGSRFILATALQSSLPSQFLFPLIFVLSNYQTCTFPLRHAPFNKAKQGFLLLFTHTILLWWDVVQRAIPTTASIHRLPFFPRNSCTLYLPGACFPLSYNLDRFKRNINSYLQLIHILHLFGTPCIVHVSLHPTILT